MSQKNYEYDDRKYSVNAWGGGNINKKTTKNMTKPQAAYDIKWNVNHTKHLPDKPNFSKSPSLIQLPQMSMSVAPKPHLILKE